MSMIQKKRNNRRKNRKNSLKDLTHCDINKVVSEFLAGGGQINHIESKERSLEEFLAVGGNGNNEADEFLNGAT